VVRVRIKADQAVVAHLIDGALHSLVGEAHVAREMRHRQRNRREGDGAEHLPANAGQPEIPQQRVAGSEQGAVQAKYVEDDVSQRSRA
jgi:hypothetical protein